MTEKEKKLRRQRYYGLGVSLIGLLFFVILFLLYQYFTFETEKVLLIVGYVIVFIGAGIYVHAFAEGLRYARSEEYKKDLMASQPWE